MRVVYSDEHRHHDAHRELIDGSLQPPWEKPERAGRVLAALRERHEIVGPHDHGRGPILAVHDERYVAFLEHAWQAWAAEHGETDALPLDWPARGLRQDRVPDAIDGQLGYFSFDAGTPITRGTWRAACAGANVASTARAMAAEDGVAFALCRPPGHHAGSSVYGGYCFLNNAAIAAQGFRDEGATRVAVLDVDYHHGNGTQQIFYDRDDVLFVSLHADPSEEYPYFLGYADETGEGAGAGHNHNFPLPVGTDWAGYRAALADGLDVVAGHGCDAVVVSLGVDTFEADPISRFRLRAADYEKLGAAIARVSGPVLFVMEGGYAVEAIGANVAAVLEGFERAR